MAKEKPYHHGNLHNTLIEAGLEILANEGANALSLRKVARRAGVSHAAPYRHFADKEALLVAIAEEGFQKLAQQMQTAITHLPGPPEQQFLDIGWAYVQFALENPDHLKVMFSGIIEDQEVDTANTFELLLATVQSCQAARVIKAGDSFQMALATWAQVHGLALVIIGKKVPPGPLDNCTQEQLARNCLQDLYYGLRT